MRAYMTNEYKQNLIGNTFISSDSSEKEYDGLKVAEIIRELTEKDYDRELIDETDKNKKGECRYLVNTMYEVRLENNEIITVYEDEINPDYRGSWGLEENKISPVITNKERCVRQGDIPEVMKLYEFIQELDKNIMWIQGMRKIPLESSSRKECCCLSCTNAIYTTFCSVTAVTSIICQNMRQYRLLVNVYWLENMEK